MTKVNPLWTLHVTGFSVPRDRVPFVVVSNHQSLADIPLISHIPWEMKWIGKAELFAIPVIGWMMTLAGDISVDRKDARSGARTIIRASQYLDKKCPVMFFPEGTRSPDGRVGRFSDGAFHLAIRTHTPILPIAVEGSSDALPKHSWRFGKPSDIHVHVLDPVSTEGLTQAELPELRDRVRHSIIREIARRRGVPGEQVDALVNTAARDTPQG
jgi:1-acyl-sn-glycerol-3-phosphate acyltransferase